MTLIGNDVGYLPGITLFLCCDLFIALRTLTKGGIHDMVDFFVWIFYIPSQVAITLWYLNRNKVTDSSSGIKSV